MMTRRLGSFPVVRSEIRQDSRLRRLDHMFGKVPGSRSGHSRSHKRAAGFMSRLSPTDPIIAAHYSVWPRTSFDRLPLANPPPHDAVTGRISPPRC